MTRDGAAGERAGQVRAVAISIGALVIVTLAMLPFRGRLDKVHIALAYLLVVLGTSAACGRTVGLSIGGVAFLLFNILFLPPYYTLALADPLDWIVLFAFLVTSFVAAELLARQRRQSEIAERRARELDELATLGAETLNAARAEQALAAIAAVIARTVGAERCQLFVLEKQGALRCAADSAGDPPVMDAAADASGLLSYIVSTQQSAIEREDGTIHVVTGRADEEPDHRPVLIRALARPLEVRGETVGALRVSSESTFTLSAEAGRLLSALGYYAALGIERLRLERVEETAEGLRRADRLKDALLASVSHDLRTPLTTIKGIAHEIAAGGQPRAYAIEEEADRLSGLVEGLLQLSQLDAGALPVHREVNTIDDLIGAALQRAESALHAHPVDVQFDHDWMLVGEFDFSHSLRILVNVLENAAKYSSAASPITIRVGRHGDRIAIAVSDRGRGIPAGDMDRVFEPFYRVPGATSDVRGAGLGLAIARRLARAQGGDLALDASGASGSTFVLQLPAGDPPTG